MTDRGSMAADERSQAAGAAWYRRHGRWIGLAAVVLSVGWLTDAKLWRPQHRIADVENIQVGEAEAWWSGRLDLTERRWDTALKDGRIYSHFPPLFSLIAAGAIPLLGGVPHLLIVLAIALPVVILAFVFFRRRTGSTVWGVVLAIALLCGTSLFPVLGLAIRTASPFVVNQLLATIGVLILLIELFGRRRVWVAGLGLLIGCLSRQLTIAYAIPLVWMAWQAPVGAPRLRALSGAAAAVVLCGAVLMTLNALKFGHPLDTGYAYIYNDRPEDDLGRDAKTYGLFSPHFLARNLYYMNLGFPDVHRIRVADREQVRLRPNRMGTGIWWTTPLLLWLVFDIRKIVADRASRMLLLAVALIVGALLLFHGTGWDQRGFNRFSLDYVIVLFALIVPACLTGRRRWISLAMIAWSLVYFVIIQPMPNVRIF